MIYICVLYIREFIRLAFFLVLSVTGLLFISYFIMPVVPCIWSDGVRTCGYSFDIDGHDLCVSHRTCVSLDFVCKRSCVTRWYNLHFSVKSEGCMAIAFIHHGILYITGKLVFLSINLCCQM